MRDTGRPIPSLDVESLDELRWKLQDYEREFRKLPQPDVREVRDWLFGMLTIIEGAAFPKGGSEILGHAIAGLIDLDSGFPSPLFSRPGIDASPRQHPSIWEIQAIAAALYEFGRDRPDSGERRAQAAQNLKYWAKEIGEVLERCGVRPPGRDARAYGSSMIEGWQKDCASREPKGGPDAMRRVRLQRRVYAEHLEMFRRGMMGHPLSMEAATHVLEDACRRNLVTAPKSDY